MIFFLHDSFVINATEIHKSHRAPVRRCQKVADRKAVEAAAAAAAGGDAAAAAGAADVYVDPAEGYVRGIRVLRLLGNIPVIRGLGASEVGERARGPFLLRNATTLNKGSFAGAAMPNAILR